MPQAQESTASLLQKVEALETKSKEKNEKLFGGDVENVIREVARIENRIQRSYFLDRIMKVSSYKRSDLNALVSQEQHAARAMVAKSETGAPWECDGKELPEGYEMELNGVVRTGKVADVITTSPLWVSNLVRNLTENRTEFELAWVPQNEHAAVKKLIVQKSIVAQPREMLKLLDDDVPLKPSAAGRVADFLMEFAARNTDALEKTKKYLVRRPGWVQLDDGTTVFAAYSDKVIFHPDPKMAAAERHLGSKGSYEQWVVGIRLMVEKSPMLGYFMTAALAAPLLEPLHLSGFVVDQFGRTSTGKTTTLRVVASMFGKPGGNEGNGLVSPWNATPTYAEEILKFYSHLPVFCMDSQDLQPPALERMAYMVGNGAGKGRGAKEGGTRERAEFKSVLLSDGEAAMYDRLDQGGAKARVLSIHGSGVAGLDASDIDMLNAVIHEHYGVVGPKFLEKVAEKWHELTPMYHRYHEQIAAKAKNSVEKRMSAYFSVMMTAAEIASLLPFFEWFFDVANAAAEQAWKKATTAYQEEARSQRALQVVADWVAMNRAHFVITAKDPEDIAPCFGRIKEPSESDEGHVGVFWSELSKVLDQKGFKGTEALRREWLEDGVLAHPNGETLRQVRIVGVKQNLVVFAWNRLFPQDAEERATKAKEKAEISEVAPVPVADSVTESFIMVLEVGDTAVTVLESGHDQNALWGLAPDTTDIVRKALIAKKLSGCLTRVVWMKPAGEDQRYITQVM